MRPLQLVTPAAAAAAAASSSTDSPASRSDADGMSGPPGQLRGHVLGRLPVRAQVDIVSKT